MGRKDEKFRNSAEGNERKHESSKQRHWKERIKGEQRELIIGNQVKIK